MPVASVARATIKPLPLKAEGVSESLHANLAQLSYQRLPKILQHSPGAVQVCGTSEFSSGLILPFVMLVAMQVTVVVVLMVDRMMDDT